MKDATPKELPLISSMPALSQATLETLRADRVAKGDSGSFFVSLGVDFVAKNPAQKDTFSSALLKEPKTTTQIYAKPNATPAACLYTWKLLDMQATTEGFRLPEFGEAIDPSPAFVDFWEQAKTDEDVIKLAYERLRLENILFDEIVNDIAEGSPDAFFRAITEEQVKKGIVYVYYSLTSLI